MDEVCPWSDTRTEAKNEGPKLIHTIAEMSHSNSLTGRRRRGSPTNKIMKTSQAVIRTPAHRGSFGNSMTRAIAEPRSSARSVLMMAISERT